MQMQVVSVRDGDVEGGAGTSSESEEEEGEEQGTRREGGLRMEEGTFFLFCFLLFFCLRDGCRFSELDSGNGTGVCSRMLGGRGGKSDDEAVRGPSTGVASSSAFGFLSSPPFLPALVPAAPSTSLRYRRRSPHFYGVAVISLRARRSRRSGDPLVLPPLPTQPVLASR